MKVQLVVLAMCVLTVEAFWSTEPRVEPHTEISTECINYAARGSCEFFRCIEERFPCGHDGFALNMMAFICDRVIMGMHTLNPKGQRWMNRTTQCMTQGLLPVYNAYSMRCGDIRDDGITSMLTCQNIVDDAGTDFCTFVRENFQAYQDIIGDEGFRRLFQTKHRRLVGPFVYDVARCGAGEILERARSAIQGIFGTALETVRDSWNRLWS